SLRDRLLRPAAARLPHLMPEQPDLDRAVGDLLAQQAHAWRYAGRSLLGAQYARTLFGLMRVPPLPALSESTMNYFDQPDAPPDDEGVGWVFKSAHGIPPRLAWTSDENFLTQFFRDGETAATALLRDVFADLGTSWRPRLGRAVFLDGAFPITKLVA